MIGIVACKEAQIKYIQRVTFYFSIHIKSIQLLDSRENFISLKLKMLAQYFLLLESSEYYPLCLLNEKSCRLKVNLWFLVSYIFYVGQLLYISINLAMGFWSFCWSQGIHSAPHCIVITFIRPLHESASDFPVGVSTEIGAPSPVFCRASHQKHGVGELIYKAVVANQKKKYGCVFTNNVLHKSCAII